MAKKNKSVIASGIYGAIEKAEHAALNKKCITRKKSQAKGNPKLIGKNRELSKFQCLASKNFSSNF